MQPCVTGSSWVLTIMPSPAPAADGDDEAVVAGLSATSPLEVMVSPSAATTMWPMTSWPPVRGLNPNSARTAPGA